VSGEPVPQIRLTVDGLHCFGENLADTTDLSQQAALWLEQEMVSEIPPDDAHRVNILSPDYEYVGVSVLIVHGKLWLTEDFGGY
jgi:uncharacterized protein YkwD